MSKNQTVLKVAPPVAGKVALARTLLKMRYPDKPITELAQPKAYLFTVHGVTGANFENITMDEVRVLRIKGFNL